MIRGSATGKKLGHLHWADVNFSDPAATLWSEISSASGTLVGNNAPDGVPAVRSGVLYQQLLANGQPALWVANSPGVDGWMQLGSGEPAPAAVNRLLGWNFDPIGAVDDQPAPVSGELWLTKIPLSTTGRITKVSMSVATAGSGMGYCRLGIYSAEGALIASSVNLTSAMATTGNKTIDLPTPSQIAAGTEVYVGLLWTGTTGPGFRGAAGAGIANMGITDSSQLRFSVSGSGLSELPSTLGAMVASDIQGWVGVS